MRSKLTVECVDGHLHRREGSIIFIISLKEYFSEISTLFLCFDALIREALMYFDSKIKYLSFLAI